MSATLDMFLSKYKDNISYYKLYLYSTFKKSLTISLHI